MNKITQFVVFILTADILHKKKLIIVFFINV